MVPAPGDIRIENNHVCRFTVLLDTESKESWSLMLARYYTMSERDTIELVLTDNTLLSVYYDDEFLRSRAYAAEEEVLTDMRT